MWGGRLVDLNGMGVCCYACEDGHDGGVLLGLGRVVLEDGRYYYIPNVKSRLVAVAV